MNSGRVAIVARVLTACLLASLLSLTPNALASPFVVAWSAPAVTLRAVGVSAPLVVNVGESVPIEARSSSLRSGETLLIQETTGAKSRTVLACSQSICSKSTHFSRAGSHTFRAVLRKGKGRKRVVLATSSALSISWRPLSLNLQATDPTGSLNTATNTQLAGLFVGIAAAAPDGKSSLWKRITIESVDSGKQVAACAPANTCAVSVREWAGTTTSAAQSVTHEYEAQALNSDGTVLLKSPPMSLTWRPWGLSLQATGQYTGTSVTASSNDAVALRAIAEHVVGGNTPDLTMIVTELGVAGARPCPGGSCTVSVGPGKGTHRYIAMVVNPKTSDVAGTSGVVSVKWCPAAAQVGQCGPLTATVNADSNDVPVEKHVILTAKASDDLTGTGHSIVISSDGGGQSSCAVNATTCTWEVTERNPVTRHFTAWVQDASGAKAGEVSPVESVEWKPWSISLDPAAQTVKVGATATLTADANYDLLPGYSLHIVEDTGASDDCHSSPCSWAVTQDTAGKHTFTLTLVAGDGSHPETGGPAKATVTWANAWTGSVTVSVDSSMTRVPVGVAVPITATISGDSLSGTGYRLVISTDTGHGTPCSTGVTCIWKYTASTPGSHTFRAWVEDDKGAHAADSSNTVTVFWEAWSITVTVIDTGVPTAGHNTYPVNNSVTISAVTNFSVSGTGLAILIRDDNANVWNCTTGAHCTTATKTLLGFSGTLHYWGEVVDPAHLNTPLARSIQPDLAVTWAPWRLELRWDDNTVSHQYALPVNTPAVVTARTNFEIQGTAFTIVIGHASGGSATGDITCHQSTGCSEQYTGTQSGDTLDPAAAVFDGNGQSVIDTTGSEVSWTGSGGGGGSFSVSLTASTTTPGANADVTLTAVSTPNTANTDYTIKIISADTGFVYNTCDSPCTVTVPFSDLGGSTGCSSEGAGTCRYEAVVLRRGDSVSNSVAESNVVSITWGSLKDSGVRAVTTAPAHSYGTFVGGTRKAVRVVPKVKNSGEKTRSYGHRWVHAGNNAVSPRHAFVSPLMYARHE